MSTGTEIIKTPDVGKTETTLNLNKADRWMGPGYPLPLSFGNRARRRKLQAQIRQGVKKGTIH